MKFWVVTPEKGTSIHDAMLTSVGFEDAIESIMECWEPGELVHLYEVDLVSKEVRFWGSYETGKGLLG